MRFLPHNARKLIVVECMDACKTGMVRPGHPQGNAPPIRRYGRGIPQAAFGEC